MQKNSVFQAASLGDLLFRKGISIKQGSYSFELLKFHDFP